MRAGRPGSVRSCVVQGGDFTLATFLPITACISEMLSGAENQVAEVWSGEVGVRLETGMKGRVAFSVGVLKTQRLASQLSGT